MLQNMADLWPCYVKKDFMIWSQQTRALCTSVTAPWLHGATSGCCATWLMQFKVRYLLWCGTASSVKSETKQQVLHKINLQLIFCPGVHFLPQRWDTAIPHAQKSLISRLTDHWSFSQISHGISGYTGMLWVCPVAFAERSVRSHFSFHLQLFHFVCPSLGPMSPSEGQRTKTSSLSSESLNLACFKNQPAGGYWFQNK